jgi:hypothetical protein
LNDPDSPALSALVALAFLAFLIPMLAQVPQGGDGAELISTAKLGGVLHPPGFPVQAWLNRIFIRLPLGTEAHRLAWLSALAHSKAVFLLMETGRILRWALAPRLLVAAVFALFPSLWSLGTQPEVFAITHALMALVIWYLALISVEKEPAGYPAFLLRALRTPVALGFVAALSVGQHPVAVTFFPMWVAALLALRSPRRSGAREFLFELLKSGTAFLLVFGLLYGSLPLLRSDSPWPDWGHLSSLGGLVRHFLRSEFGTFSLTPNTIQEPMTALRLFLGQAATRLNFILLLALLGAFGAQTPMSRVFRRGLLAALILGFVFLNQAETNGGDPFSLALLERFFAPAVMPLAVLAGAGLQLLNRRSVRLAMIFAAVFLVFLGVSGYREADSSFDNTIEVFRRAIALELPREAIYVGGQSEEYFSGIPQADGSLRFPVLRGIFLLRPWYFEQVLPRVEPRLAGSSSRNMIQLLSEAEARSGTSWPIASIDDQLFADLKREAEVRGAIRIAWPGRNESLTMETVRSAVRLCPLIQELSALPEQSHGFAKQLRLIIGRGFGNAAIQLRASGNPVAGAAAEDIYQGLKSSRDANSWRNGCARLIQSGAGNF